MSRRHNTYKKLDCNVDLERGPLALTGINVNMCTSAVLKSGRRWRPPCKGTPVLYVNEGTHHTILTAYTDAQTPTLDSL